MVDFSILNKSPTRGKSKSLFQTFAGLDRKVSHVELRASQVELFKIIDERIDDAHLVLKLSTGGGKTTTGLIYLKQKMDQYGEPVVFLVPTTQLAEQVVEEGERIGIPVVCWAKGETYPPGDGVRSVAVMVCTYDKFFNGKSTFARNRLTPCAIVLDDVHAGIESIKGNFSADLSDQCRDKLTQLLSEPLKNLEPANWSRVEYGDPDGMVEVPHWVIADYQEQIRGVLSEFKDEAPLVFAWPYISREIQLSRLIISGQAAAIAIDPPQIELLEHYVNAKHRLFMSASVHDGSSLIRELGCSPEAAERPVEIAGELPAGERMVLVPTLINPDFNREAILGVAKKLLHEANVVVLVASEAAAKFWVEGGASVALGSRFGESVAALKSSGKGSFVVFVNRYDGIDLPDSACRILIIDGLPTGDGLIDRLDGENAGGVTGMRGKVANRVEQGLGRAVRSNSDYCAVILSGADLATFVSRKIALQSFSPATVRQIEIGREISKAIAEEGDKEAGLVATISQLLSRDPNWREYYKAQMSVRPDSDEDISAEAKKGRSVALAERSAAGLAMARDYLRAANELRQVSNLLGSDRHKRGLIKQQAAKNLYVVDRVGGMELQGSAYADNYNLSRPPILPAAAVRKITSQASQIADWLRGFADMNGAILALDNLVGKISYSNSPPVVEAAMLDLGAYLGGVSSRPEKECGRGPDNLWVFGDRAICLEMKNEKAAKLWKDDAGQIALSERWVKDNVKGLAEVYSLIGSNVEVADRKEDFSDHVQVLTEEAVMSLISKLRGMLVGLITQGPLFACEAANIQPLLGRHEILPQQIALLGIKIRG